jgi:competence protein ComEC
VEVLHRFLPAEEANVLAPMLVGDTSGLSREQKAGFSDAGVMHVLVVSGMNVAYVAGLFLFLFRLLGLPRRPAALCTIPCILLYVLVTGMNPPVVRAGVMALFVILSLSLRREPLIYQSLSLAAFVILLFDPQALFSASFQLSFAATLGIVSLSPLLLRPFAPLPGWLRWSIGGLVSVSLAAQLAVLPLLAFYFNKLSLVGLLSNLCIVPLTCLITIAGMLLYAAHLISAPLAGAIACGTGWLLHLLLLLVRCFAALPHATLHVATPSLFTFIAYYLLLFSLPNLGRHRALRLTCAVIAAAWIAAFLWQRHDANRRVEITFLSVGNGDAVHIAFPGDRHWLIDGGGPAAGERLLCPYLWSRGISRLETVVVTHPHSPHYGGLPAVLRNFSVGQVLFCPAVSGEREFARLLALVQEKGIPWKEAWAPDTFSVGRASVTVLSPERLGATPDDNALALLAAFEGQRVLLTSDMGAEAEARLTSSGAVRAELLQLPNHGNRALSQGFLMAVSPRCCIVSTRRTRSAGNPCPVPHYSTRSSGAVTVELRRGKWLIREYRSPAGK